MAIKNKPIVALMHDFDKTLSPKNMQEYSFIPNLGIKANDFWKKSNDLAAKEKMDSNLAYMYSMITESSRNDRPIKRQNFVDLGKDIEYFAGVDTWFARINKIGRNLGLNVQHFIISSGLREIIEGTSIFKHFKEVYACEFYYDVNGIACWPKSVVNYTTKTQFLFRINKGALDLSKDKEVNAYADENKRPIPFWNMIYFGDGPQQIFLV